jgi:hypothetical protein
MGCCDLTNSGGYLLCSLASSPLDSLSSFTYPALRVLNASVSGSNLALRVCYLACSVLSCLLDTGGCIRSSALGISNALHSGTHLLLGGSDLPRSLLASLVDTGGCGSSSLSRVRYALFCRPYATGGFLGRPTSLLNGILGSLEVFCSLASSLVEFFLCGLEIYRRALLRDFYPLDSNFSGFYLPSTTVPTRLVQSPLSLCEVYYLLALVELHRGDIEALKSEYSRLFSIRLV